MIPVIAVPFRYDLICVCNIDLMLICVSPDEMYAAIPDAYTSGSDTYAQIQPVTSNSTYETPNEASTSQRFSVASSVHSRQGLNLTFKLWRALLTYKCHSVMIVAH